MQGYYRLLRGACRCAFLSLSLSLKRGIPIGNLTSQLFANIYLNELDQFVKHVLREPYYVRYMDDFIILHHDKRHLRQVLQRLEVFCSQSLALQLHPRKTNIHQFCEFERFVGYDLGPYLRRLSKPTLQRFERRTHRLVAIGRCEAATLSRQQFKAYASFAHTAGLFKRWDI